MAKNKTWETAASTELFNAILLLDNLTEAKKFLRDLMTESEIKEFSNRWQAAQMLEKKIPYTQIEKSTGLSPRTIARINHWRLKGMGGYKAMLKKIKKAQ